MTIMKSMSILGGSNLRLVVAFTRQRVVFMEAVGEIPLLGALVVLFLRNIDHQS